MRQLVRKKSPLVSPRLYSKKRRRRIVLTIISILVPALSVAGLSWLSYADTIQIDKISVLGAQTIGAEAIEGNAQALLAKPYLGFFSRSTPLTYPREEIASSVKAYGPKIKEVDVSISGLKTLSIKIVEREPVAVWCNNGSCLLLDNSGMAYDMATTTESGIVFSSAAIQEPKPGDRIADAPAFVSLMQLLKAMPDFGFVVSAAHFSSEGDISLSMASSGPKVILAIDQDTLATYNRLNALMRDVNIKSQIKNDAYEYVDLRFGNKVYYKLRSGASASSTVESSSSR